MVCISVYTITDAQCIIVNLFCDLKIEFNKIL